MTDLDSGRIRFEVALQDSQPVVALDDLAKTLKNEGMGQVAMYHLYHGYFKQLTGQDEPRADAIADVLDTIWGGGWAKGRALFDKVLTNADVAE